MPTRWVTVTGGALGIAAGFLGFVLKLFDATTAAGLVIMALSFIGIGLGRKMDRIEDAKNNQGCEKLSDLEKEQLGRAFQQFDGNYRAMARALGISKHALYEKLKSYGILVEKIPQ